MIVYKDQEIHYGPILDIIDRKARNRLDSLLHLAGYLLNQYYTYVNSSSVSDGVVMGGFMECVEKIYDDDVDLQDKIINVELHKYLNKEGSFGKPIALMGCSQDSDTYYPDKKTFI
ncbi:hypothetical protein QQ045_032396 [Rhodiola kirilowii]